MQKFWVYGFGLGLIPFFPGTFGSLLAYPFFWLSNQLWPFIQLSLLLLYFAISSFFLRNTLKKNSSGQDHDRPQFVCDEVAGMWLCLIGTGAANLQQYLGIFILFRFFDIAKPFPISYLDENIRGAIGVMVDDIAAAIAAIGSYYLCLYLIAVFRNQFI